MSQHTWDMQMWWDKKEGGRQNGDEREKEEYRLGKRRGIRNESLGGNEQRRSVVCSKKEAQRERYSRNSFLQLDMRSMRVKDMQMYGDGKDGWRERLMG